MATMLPWGSRLTQLLDDAFMNVANDGDCNLSAPHANVVELADSYEISLDMPGLGGDDFHVEFEEGKLTVSGERTFEHAAEDDSKKLHRVERRYGKFSRTFSMPRDADVERIEAHYDRGVLRVTVAKSELSRPRKINVRSEG